MQLKLDNILIQSLKGVKKCSSCKKTLSLDNFYSDKKREYHLYCKKCNSSKAKESYNKNLEVNREKKRIRGANDPLRRQRHRDWYLKNRDKKLKQNKEWKKQNPERYKEIIKNWAKNNPEKVKEKEKKFLRSPKGKLSIRQRNHNRKAKIRNAGGKHTYQEWEVLKEMHKYTCVFCRRKEPEIKLTRDHIIPVSKGGNNYIENIQPLCQSCNSKKHDKIITNGIV